ncbi:MAG: CoA transferase [Dehalococcoidia bacterium]
MPMPLEGVRVIDCTIWQMGPWATMMLGDLGAEVIKIEDPVLGDPSRGLTMMWGQSMQLSPGRSVLYECSNRNKKSMTLDLKKKDALEIVYRLVERSDIFVQNMAPGVADRLGVGYEVLRQHNPKLIYGSGSSNGPYGPDAAKPGMDPVVAARSGFIDALTPPGQTPQYVLGFGDLMAAVMLVQGILAALTARERLGVGQKVEASVLGSLVWLQNLIVNMHLLTGHGFPRFDRFGVQNPMSNFYQCSDGKWLYLNLHQPDRFWSDCCKALGIEELEKDPRFDTTEKRVANSKEVISIFGKAFAARTRSEWLKVFRDYPNFQYEPVQSASDLPADPQIIENNYIVDVDHPVLGSIKMVGLPVLLSQTPAAIKTVAPEHGQHTEEVLLEICGYSWDKIAELKNKKVI